MSTATKPPGSDAVTAALRRAAYEVIPIEGVDEAVSGLPEGARLTVTCSPVHGVDRTVGVAARLSARGFQVVPHVSARLVTDRRHLEKIVTRLREHHIREVFVVGGDIAEPAGEFSSSGQLLEALAEQTRCPGRAGQNGHGGQAGSDMPFREVGIGGYPEGHPFLAEATLTQALWDKHAYATYVVTQLCFDAEAISTWVARMRRNGMTLPVDVGIPGAVPLTKLMRTAVKVGAGESVRFLRNHRGLLKAVAGPRAYSPDGLVAGLEPMLEDPASGVRGLHFYTFNEVGSTESWRQAVLAEPHAA